MFLQLHRDAVVEATRVMVDQTLPSVAASLTLADVHDVGAYLQERGVNLRFLGRVRTHCTDAGVRAALLQEMVARVTQKHLRAQWRGDVAVGYSTLPSLKMAVAVLNAVRGTTGEPVWLRQGLRDKYGVDAPSDEEPLQAGQALRRICELSGLHVAEAALSTADEPLTVSDVALDARVKELGLSLLARADELFVEAKSKQKSRERTLELLREVAAILNRELIADPENVAIHARLARVQLLRMKRVALDAERTAECMCVEEGLGTALRALDAHPNDSALLRCKHALLKVRQALAVLDVESAVPRLAEALQQAALLDARGPWIFARDAGPVALRAVDRLRERLHDALAALVDAISFASDYEPVQRLLAGEQHAATAVFKRILPNAAAVDWRLPKYLWLALLLAERNAEAAAEARAWFAQVKHLDLDALTHCAVTDEVATRLLQYAAPTLQSVSLNHCIVTGLAMLPPQVTRVALHGCNFVTSDGVVAMLRAHSSLEQLEVVDCSMVMGPALWSHLPRSLRSLKLSRCLRLTVPEHEVALPPTLCVLEMMHCPAAVLGAAFVSSLPATLLELAADDMAPAVAALLPRSLERLWLRSQLTGCELNLPQLRRVHLGHAVNGDGLAALCSHSPLLEELDVSRCPNLLDAHKIAAALQGLPHLEALNVSADLPLSNEAVVAPLLASGARLRSINCAGAW